MVFNLFIVLNLIVLCYIWFNTEAVPEWARFLRLKFLKGEEYFNFRKNTMLPHEAQMTFPEYLLYKYGHKSFFIRLITCSECGIVWLNLVAYVIFGVCYHKMEVLWLGFNILMCWLGYHALSKTMKDLLNA